MPIARATKGIQVKYIVGGSEVKLRPGTVLLEPRDWDDFTYRTEFTLHLPDEHREPVRIGEVKILARNYGTESPYRRTRDVLPTRFESLNPDEFCSLGQDTNYYRMLGQLAEDAGVDIISDLNDICFANVAERWWEDHPGYSSSLLRFNSANLARRDARLVFAGKESSGDIHHFIHFERQHGFVRWGPSSIDFAFDGSLRVPGRLNVVVGRNGTGKTSLLSGLANWFAQEAPKSKFDYKPAFSRVLIVSFNPHDQEFHASRAAPENVRFIGYRPPSEEVLDVLEETPNLSRLSAEAWEEKLLKLFPRPQDFRDKLPHYSEGAPLLNVLRELRGDNDWLAFVGAALEDELFSETLGGSDKQIAKVLEQLSAGQRVLLELYSRIYRGLDNQALVLVDEPECHLHPSLIARFVRNFNDMLTERRAFAIVATHSPIIVQETPSRFVTILERTGTADTSVKRPSFETFGASIEEITEHLFDTDFRSSHWKRVLKELTDEGLTMEEAESEIGPKSLSPFARSFLAYHIVRRDRR